MIATLVYTVRDLVGAIVLGSALVGVIIIGCVQGVIALCRRLRSLGRRLRLLLSSQPDFGMRPRFPLPVSHARAKHALSPWLLLGLGFVCGFAAAVFSIGFICTRT